MGQNGDRPLITEEQEFLQGLYQRHYRALFDYAYRLGVGREAAEDYAQDAFLAAVRHIEDIKKSKNPRKYLNQVLKNVIGYRLRSLRYALDLQKKLQEGLENPKDESYPDVLKPETEYHGIISDEELALLIRFYLDGWTQKDLAEQLGISENACRLRIRRAKKHLKSALEEDKPPGPDIRRSKDSTSTEGGPGQR